MSNTNSVDFSLIKKELSPTALACFRVFFQNIRETTSTGEPQQKYEVPVAEILALNEVADLEAVAQSIRDIIQCKVEVKVDNYVCFYPFFTAVSIKDGKVCYSIHRDLEEEISRMPAIFFV